MKILKEKISAFKCYLGYHKWNPIEEMRYNSNGWACAPYSVKTCDRCGKREKSKQYCS